MDKSKIINTKSRIIALRENLRGIVNELEGISGNDNYIKSVFINKLRARIEDDGKSIDTSFNFNDLIDYLKL